MSLHSFAAFGALISFLRIHYDNKTSIHEHYQVIFEQVIFKNIYLTKLVIHWVDIEYAHILLCIDRS